MPLVPVANSPTYQATASDPSQNQQQLVYDFTKRKRWADLLVQELTEAIMLILSQTGQVWYCGPAVEELLGWKDEEVTDTNVCDIMNADDRATFQRQFSESIQNRTDLLAYARLQCKTSKDLYPNVPAPQPVGLVQHMEDKPSPKEVLFEIKGYPHFVTGRDSPASVEAFNANAACVMDRMIRSASERTGSEEPFKCFFAMAKPYPSRNTAMLNTFLELKMENERLQARLRAAKAQAESLNISTTPSSMQRTVSVPSTVPSQTQNSFPMPGRSFPYAFQSVTQPTSDESPTYISYDASVSGTQSGPSQSQGDDHETGSNSEQPRKKPKRIMSSDMYVCTQCGRTDSPEWRKGPQGPKTLCNACGLRWAKSNRGPKESPTTTVPSTSTTTNSNQHSFSVANSRVSSVAHASTSSGNSTSTGSPLTPGNTSAGAGAGLGAPFMNSAFVR